MYMYMYIISYEHILIIPIGVYCLVNYTIYSVLTQSLLRKISIYLHVCENIFVNEKIAVSHLANCYYIYLLFPYYSKRFSLYSTCTKSTDTLY